MVFSPVKEAVRWGARLAGVPHKEKPSQSNPLATGSELEQTNAPEGGGTTQRGDPAPGPMRCGTTASGDERMHQ